LDRRRQNRHNHLTDTTGDGAGTAGFGPTGSPGGRNVQEFLPFIIAGIAAGSIYGLAATGLVLTYKTSGIFNFGQGALATAAAYIFYAMHYANNVNWVVSLIVSVVIAGPLMGLGM